MRARWLQHVPFEGLGSIEPWLARRGAEVACTRLWAGDALPETPDHDCLIVMGGPMNVDETDRHPWLAAERAFVAASIEAGRAVLGVCLGAQLVARALGAAVTRNPEPEIGWHRLRPAPGAADDPLAAPFLAAGEAFHWHGDRFDVPAGARLLAASAACDHQAFALGDRVLAIQFHLETTEAGARALIEHCADEIVDAPHVHDGAEMLRDPARFARINRAMDAVLDALLG